LQSSRRIQDINDDNVIIAVRLIRTADGSPFWSETFERQTAGIVDAEEEIGRRVAASLNIDLRGRKLAPQRTNAEAYRAFLQGNDFLAHGKVEKALEYLQQSIKFDPKYTPAWVSLSEAHIFQAGAALIPPAEGYKQARETVERALMLDPNLGDAHAVLAEIQTFHDWDWAGAMTSSRRALELESGDSGIISVAASLSRVLGQFDEAIALYHRSLEIDPLHTNAYKNLGLTLYYAGRYVEAEANLNKAFEQIPGMWDGHFYLSQVYLMNSRPLEALAEADKEKRPAFRLAGLALANGALGRRSESDANLARLLAEYPKQTPCQIAEVYSFRGEMDPAFEWLERAYALRDDSLPEIKGDPLLKGLRGDRRYAALVRKIGLPL
jgi:tetratricopeptide (TPR) repeat protein